MEYRTFLKLQMATETALYGYAIKDYNETAFNQRQKDLIRYMNEAAETIGYKLVKE